MKHTVLNLYALCLTFIDCQEKYTVGKIPIVFESCEPGGAFLPPAYELNGMVMHGSELLTDYISSSKDGGYYFTISNVTEDIVLLEYCIQSSEVLCDICEHSRQDTFLSRSEIDINYNDGKNACYSRFSN